MRKQKLETHLKEMKEKEKQMEEEMGSVLVDINQKQSKKQPTANDGSKSTNTSSKKLLLQPNPFKMMMSTRFGVKPLNQKKVSAIQGGAGSKDIQNGVSEGMKKKSDVLPVASGMQKFIKANTTDAAPVSNPKANVPMIFRRKAPVK